MEEIINRMEKGLLIIAIIGTVAMTLATFGIENTLHFLNSSLVQIAILILALSLVTWGIYKHINRKKLVEKNRRGFIRSCQKGGGRIPSTPKLRNNIRV